MILLWKRKYNLFIFCITGLILLSGCSLILSSASSDMMKHLSYTILNNDDLTLVKNGAPAYLLMIDSLISKDPGNENLLLTASTLYTAYADLFVKETGRSRKIADKALNYAAQAMCLDQRSACHLKSIPYDRFQKIISQMTKTRVPALFTLGNAWAGWIMANKNDFNAIADISRIELIMKQVIHLDKTYRDGAAYIYLGALATFLPPGLGGKPEIGRQYFETAVKLSKGKNLMVKVIFAKLYAKMIFDRKLHDRLLEEVLAADPYVPGYTLVNTWAQKQAKELIAGADEYF